MSEFEGTSRGILSTRVTVSDWQKIWIFDRHIYSAFLPLFDYRLSLWSEGYILSCLHIVSFWRSFCEWTRICVYVVMNARCRVYGVENWCRPNAIWVWHQDTVPAPRLGRHLYVYVSYVLNNRRVRRSTWTYWRLCWVISKVFSEHTYSWGCV